MFGSRQECKYKYKIHNLVNCYGALCRVAWVTMMLILALRAAHNRAALAKQPFSVVGRRNTITVVVMMMMMMMMVDEDDDDVLPTYSYHDTFPPW